MATPSISTAHLGLCCLLVCVCLPYNAESVGARLVGDLQYVYDWTTEHCPKHPDYNRCVYSFKCKNMTEQNLNLCRDCDPDVVDAPPKAFRRLKQPMSVSATSLEGVEYETVLTGSVNWGSRAQVGPDLESVKHTCDVNIPLCAGF
jgi:hypothetical protein